MTSKTNELQAVLASLNAGNVIETGGLFPGLCKEPLVWCVDDIEVVGGTRYVYLRASYAGIDLGAFTLVSKNGTCALKETG